MYSSDKPRPLDFYEEEVTPSSRDNMIMEVVSSNGDLPPHHLPTTTNTNPHQMILGDSSGDDNHEVKAPKKRAETWVQDETRSLIGLRREMDGLFNTSKSNKHLWEQISAKMREKGFDRSPTMCTDKWRNLLKEFKKAKHKDRGSGSAKMSYYKEIDEILRERNKNPQYKSPIPSKVDSYMQFADKVPTAIKIPDPYFTTYTELNLMAVSLWLMQALKIQAYHLDPWKAQLQRSNVFLYRKTNQNIFYNVLDHLISRKLDPGSTAAREQLDTASSFYAAISHEEKNCKRTSSADWKASTEKNQDHFICGPAFHQQQHHKSFLRRGIRKCHFAFARTELYLYTPVFTKEASPRPTLNLERRLDHDGHPLAITAADAVAASGVPPWNWRETPGNGAENQSYGGRVISVKYGDYTRRIGVDGTADAIKEAIKAAFRLRSKRAFWLEDEDQIIRSLDREMPPGNYTLHLDEGLAIKVCLYDESDHMPVHTEEKIFYTEDDYRDFLTRRGWTCLREFDGYRNIDSMDDLRHDAIYRGVS
ncbi:hypothetical protein NC653_024676 [Populus alba x Populus x berolinensis]|uniref:Myb-like domain-containing protein n=1 Tax=Populus alba x Populus x berolinensis TaxID=444605 RepID=A0AAD6MA70_9ROSI|nr:hypothetical protein NC653_024676 [Populus alba x Populus x berolinensis]